MDDSKEGASPNESKDMTFLWPKGLLTQHESQKKRKASDESSIVPTESTERQEYLCKERRSGIDDESASETMESKLANLCAAKEI